MNRTKSTKRTTFDCGNPASQIKRWKQQKQTVEGNYDALMNKLTSIEEKLDGIEKKYCDEIESSITSTIPRSPRGKKWQQMSNNEREALNNHVKDLTGQDLNGFVDKLVRSVSSLDNSIQPKPRTVKQTIELNEFSENRKKTIQTMGTTELQMYAVQVDPERACQMYRPGRRPKTWTASANPTPRQRLLRSRSPPPLTIKTILVDRGSQTTDLDPHPLCFSCKQKVYDITPECIANKLGHFGNDSAGEKQFISIEKGGDTKRVDELKRNGQGTDKNEHLHTLVHELTAPRDKQAPEKIEQFLKEKYCKEKLEESLVYHKFGVSHKKEKNVKYIAKSKLGLQNTHPTRTKLNHRYLYNLKSSSEVRRQAEKLAVSLVQRLVKKQTLKRYNFGYEGDKAAIINCKRSKPSREESSGTLSTGSKHCPSTSSCSSSCECDSTSCSTCSSSTSCSGPCVEDRYRKGKRPRGTMSDST